MMLLSKRKILLKNGQSQYDEAKEQPELKAASDTIFNIFMVAGTALIVVVGGILGIQFIMASAEEKAKIKESFMPYILGTVVIFGAFAIWRFTMILGNAVTGEKILSGSEDVGAGGYSESDYSWAKRYESEGIEGLLRWYMTDQQVQPGYEDIPGYGYQGVSLQEALEKLPAEKRVTYDQAYTRGLLQVDKITLRAEWKIRLENEAKEKEKSKN